MQLNPTLGPQFGHVEFYQEPRSEIWQYGAGGKPLRLLRPGPYYFRLRVVENQPGSRTHSDIFYTNPQGRRFSLIKRLPKAFRAHAQQLSRILSTPESRHCQGLVEPADITEQREPRREPIKGVFSLTPSHDFRQTLLALLHHLGNAHGKETPERLALLFPRPMVEAWQGLASADTTAPAVFDQQVAFTMAESPPLGIAKQIRPPQALRLQLKPVG